MNHVSFLKFTVWISILASLGCAKPEAVTQPSTQSSAQSAAQPVVSPAPEKPSPIACVVKPEKEVDVEFTEGHMTDDAGNSIESKQLINSSYSSYSLNANDPDAYVCGHLKGWAAHEPELVLIVGNQDGLDSFAKRIDLFVHAWVWAAAGSHRSGCVFVLSKSNLDRIAAREGVERIVFVGHGANGDLAAPTEERIRPEELTPFVSTKIKEVHFFSCEAGQKEETWKTLFAASSSKLDLSKDTIAVQDALDQISGLVKKIWMCKI